MKKYALLLLLLATPWRCLAEDPPIGAQLPETLQALSSTLHYQQGHHGQGGLVQDALGGLAGVQEVNHHRVHRCRRFCQENVRAPSASTRSAHDGLGGVIDALDTARPDNALVSLK